MQEQETKKVKENQFLRDLVRVFVIPNVINKPLMLYFGLKYTKYPDQGYGYGLAATVLFFLISMGLFLWKYRHMDDPD